MKLTRPSVRHDKACHIPLLSASTRKPRNELRHLIRARGRHKKPSPPAAQRGPNILNNESTRETERRRTSNRSTKVAGSPFNARKALIPAVKGLTRRPRE